MLSLLSHFTDQETESHREQAPVQRACPGNGRAELPMDQPGFKAQASTVCPHPWVSSRGRTRSQAPASSMLGLLQEA